MTIIINNQIICTDGCIPIPEENAVQFYREKSDLDLDYTPFSITVDANMLSDFGKDILCK